MGQLGYALTGAAQGLASGMQYKNEQKEKKRRDQADKERFDYQKTKDADEKAYREGQVARDDLSRVEGYLNDPDASQKYTPEQLAGFDAKRKAIFARHPDLDPSQTPATVKAQADLPYGQGTGGGEPVTQHAAATPATGAPDMTPADLFDLQQQNKPQPAPWQQDPLQSLGVGTAPAEPTIGGPPITGTQNPVTRGSFPVNPFPPQPVAAPGPTAIPHQAPVPAPPQAPAYPLHALMADLKQRIDTAPTGHIKSELTQQFLAAYTAIAEGDYHSAEALLANAKARLAGPESAANNALAGAQAESARATAAATRSSTATEEALRNPRVAGEKAKNRLATAQAGLAEIDSSLRRIESSATRGVQAAQVEEIKAHAAALRREAAAKGNDPGLMFRIQEFQQRLNEYDRTGQWHEEEVKRQQDQEGVKDPARATFARGLMSSLIYKDPAGNTVVKPGAMATYDKGMRGWDKQHGVNSSNSTYTSANPGFAPSVWERVNSMGFDLPRALAGLDMKNPLDKRLAGELKNAYTFANRK